MLFLQNTTKKVNTTFVKVSNSYFNVKLGDSEFQYDTVSGAVTGIELRDHEYEGEKFKAWHILMEDRNSGACYDIRFGIDSGAFRTAIRALSSEDGLRHLDDIEMNIYQTKYGGYTNLLVNGGGKKLSWRPTEVPPLEYVKVGDKFEKSNEKRVEWAMRLVTIINSNVDRYSDDYFNGDMEEERGYQREPDE